jgi:uncharacterized protein YecT (DUF1311 family)
MMKINPLIFLVIFFTNSAYTQELSKHAIDIQIENCHRDKANQTTRGMITCEQLGLELWDKELNKTYNELMPRLNREEKEALKKSQRSWIAYRDQEIIFSSRFYTKMQGTMWGLVATSRKREITRARAIELKEYLEVLDN